MDASEDNVVCPSLTGDAFEFIENRTVADEAGVVDASEDNVVIDSLTGVAFESDDN